MSTDELARRAARREIEIVKRMAMNHHGNLIPWLTLFSALLFLLIVFTPRVVGEVTESFATANAIEHRELAVKDAELYGLSLKNAGRIDAMEARITNLVNISLDNSKELARIEGVGGGFAGLLVFLQVWQIRKNNVPPKVVYVGGKSSYEGGELGDD